jgi:hypothetical protein
MTRSWYLDLAGDSLGRLGQRNRNHSQVTRSMDHILVQEQTVRHILLIR